jgi:F-type H+-transporting ATPase subunit gamma
MQSASAIRRRIRSISNTSLITKAMQMVAASKMRRAQEAAVAGRPFVRLLYRMQRATTGKLAQYTHPLLEVREVRKRAVILVSTDKGLCGALNANLFRLVSQFDPETTVFIAVGKKGAQFIARTHRHLAAEFTYSETPRFAEASAVAAFATDLFLKGQVDAVHVICTRFVDTLNQQPLSLEFLPIGEIKAPEMHWADIATDLSEHKTECLFEPSRADVLDFFLSRYPKIYLYQALLNAKASEHSARMVSMKNATESAEKLIADLTLEYNKMRQDNITQELLEIAGGQAG